MKAIVLHEKGDVRCTDFPVAKVGPNDVKIAVAYCGICGSDVHKYLGKKNTHPIHYPVPLGHEISGHVVEVGENVVHLKVGDAVTADPNWFCGRCSFCQRGLTQFCEHARGVVKGMAEYVVSPQENVYLLPDGMDMRAASLAEPLACCLRGMDQLEVHHGQRVALIGYGAIGRIMLQLLRLSGAGDITVLDTNTALADAAIAAGAARFVDARDEDAISKLEARAQIDCVLECVGHHAAQQTALRIAGKGARVVFFGVNDEADMLPFYPYQAFLKELTIRTSFTNPHTTQRAIQLLASGLLDVDGIIGRTVEMEEVPGMFERGECGAMGKTVVRIGSEA